MREGLGNLQRRTLLLRVGVRHDLEQFAGLALGNPMCIQSLKTALQMAQVKRAGPLLAREKH
ncbi:hypothetical protein D3C80_1498420 [compost metagenome]